MIQPDREVIAGAVERVTFHNAENGFCVLRIEARGHRDLVTVVGHAATISAGEWLTASGEWSNDRTHGQQFKAAFMRTSAPSSLEGIEKYLASGMIRGIGPVYGKKMVQVFGEKVFDIIETEPDRLREVAGIGPVRARRITTAWAEQKIVREIMVFLHSHGVGTARAVRIYKTYGVDAVKVITDNPYRLARYLRHWLQDCRRDRHPARDREDGDDPGGGTPLLSCEYYWASLAKPANPCLRGQLLLCCSDQSVLEPYRGCSSRRLDVELALDWTDQCQAYTGN